MIIQIPKISIKLKVDLITTISNSRYITIPKYCIIDTLLAITYYNDRDAITD